MAYTNYFGWPITVDTAVVNQVQSISVDRRIDAQLGASAGGVEPDVLSVFSAAPTISFATTDIKTTLDKTGISTGYKLTSGHVGKVVLVKLDETTDSQVASGSVHRLLTINQGIVFPTSLSATRGGRAVLTCSIIPTYDGTNNPIVEAGSSGLTPASRSFIGEYTLGRVTLNGTTYKAIQSVTIDFGISVETDYEAGGTFPTQHRVVARSPSISLGGNSPDTFIAAGQTGLAVNSSTKAKIYLGLMGADSVLGASSALSFDVTNGLITVGGISAATGASPFRENLNITARTDLTNASLIYQTAQTLP